MLIELLHLINPLSYFRLFVEILKSLKKPVLQDEKPWRFQWQRIVFMVFIISVFFKITGLLVHSWVSSKIGVDHKEPREMTLLFTIITVVILAPIIEEFTFRLANRFNTLNFSISTSLLIAIFGLGKFIKTFVAMHVTDKYLVTFLNLSLRLVCAAFIGFFLFSFLKQYERKISEIGKSKFIWIFYTYAILFGFAHITNFQLTFKNLIYIVPLTLPQIFGGLFLGYTRINFGLKYSILQHSLGNFLVTIPAIISHFAS